MATNRSTVTIEDTAESIFAELRYLQKRIAALQKKVIKLFPAKYGSDLWWEKEMKEAEEEFRQGKGIKFNSAKEAIKWLNS